ncbi:MAG: hypothetical protein DRN00_03710 [Thermoplasmata archaeon]|nr:MAG: hypothetical protein DRN00_03710 [Thermoplasmata archaeon]
MKVLVPLLIASIFLLSGCIDIITESYIVYASSPTLIEYNISYGYRIYLKGNLNFNYTCPVPVNSIETNLIYPYGYRKEKIGENILIKWWFNESGEKNFSVGITSKLVVKSFVVDLNRKGVKIDEIPEDLINQYCRVESTKESEKNLIDPRDPEIVSLALSIKGEENDAFLVARKIFEWLKKNTCYKAHEGNANPQPAIETLHLKSGDCDDLTFLYISLCRAVNIPARFIRGYIIDTSKGSPRAVPHAWAEVYVGFGRDGWIPVECSGTSNDVESEVYQNFGVEDAHHIRIFIDEGSNDSIEISCKGPTLQYTEEVDLEDFVIINEYKEISYGSLTIYRDGRREFK